MNHHARPRHRLRSRNRARPRRRGPGARRRFAKASARTFRNCRSMPSPASAPWSPRSATARGAWTRSARRTPANGARPSSSPPSLAPIDALKPKLVTFNGLELRPARAALSRAGARFARTRAVAARLFQPLQRRRGRSLRRAVLVRAGGPRQTARDRQNAEPARQTRRHRRIGDRDLRPRAGEASGKRARPTHPTAPPNASQTDF